MQVHSYASQPPGAYPALMEVEHQHLQHIQITTEQTHAERFATIHLSTHITHNPDSLPVRQQLAQVVDQAHQVQPVLFGVSQPAAAAINNLQRIAQ